MAFMEWADGGGTSVKPLNWMTPCAACCGKFRHEPIDADEQEAESPLARHVARFILLRVGTPVGAAHTTAGKLEMLASCGSNDQILPVRRVRYPTRQGVMAIDELGAAR